MDKWEIEETETAVWRYNRSIGIRQCSNCYTLIPCDMDGKPVKNANFCHVCGKKMRMENEEE